MNKVIHELNNSKIAFKTDLGGKELSAFRAGGKALVTAYPESVKALERLKDISEAFSLPLYPFGLGSNTLILDGGYDGIMVSMVGMRRISASGNELTLSAGIPVTVALDIAAEKGLGGLEELGGIPATIGGMTKTNAGAFGREMSDLVAEATVFDMKTGEVYKIKGSETDFEYRTSGATFHDKIILSVKLDLMPAAKIKEKCAYYTALRRETQPSRPSLGSTFKRTPDGIGAGYYIDKAGLKGTVIGGAEISSKHAGFIVNRGHATAADYTKLMALSSGAVKRKFGIDLEPEIEIIGKEINRDDGART